MVRESWYLFDHLVTPTKQQYSPIEADEMAVGLLSIPFAGGCVYGGSGVALGPQALQKIPTMYLSDYTESGLYIGQHLLDLGTIDLPSGAQVIDATAAIVPAVHRHLQAGIVPILLGGDHSITYSGIMALSQHRGCDGLIWMDAHLDVAHYACQPVLHHGSVLKHIIDDHLVDPDKVIILGYRETGLEEMEFLHEFTGLALSTFDVCRMQPGEITAAVGEVLGSAQNLYWSLDIDIVYPAFVPGTSCRAPGGLSSRQFLNIIYELGDWPPIATDIVEFDPTHDIGNLSAEFILPRPRFLLDTELR